MRRRWGLVVATAALGAAGLASADGACQLSQIDRATTQSSTCMACHDGSAGPTIAFDMATGGMSHPVAVDYASVVAKYPDTYVPPVALPAGVLLVNGRVECTSCHDGSLTTRNHVVDEMQLCYGCHRL